MKKLLLASIIMFGICSFTYAQTPDAVKAKKEAAKKNNSAVTPAFTNPNGLTPQKAAVATTTAVDIDGTVVESKAATIEKTDAEIAKKVAQAKEAEKSAVKKTKD